MNYKNIDERCNLIIKHDIKCSKCPLVALTHAVRGSV